MQITILGYRGSNVAGFSNQALPMKKEWALLIKEQCDALEKSFFLKQWGTWGADGIKRSKGKNGKELEGEIHHSMPIVR